MEAGSTTNNNCEKQGDIRWQEKMGEKHKEQKQKREGKGPQILQDASNMQPWEFQLKWRDQWLLKRGQIERIMTKAAERKVEKWDGDL
jgi:hypothetical protein